MRETILAEIRRLAANGKPPGRAAFERETGIKASAWLGVLWARWGDALVEAGFEPNEFQGKADADFLCRKLVEAFRHYGKVPVSAELRMYRKRCSQATALSSDARM